MRVLVVNAGSSTIKLRLLDGDDRLLDDHEIELGPSGVDPDALRGLLESGLGDADAVGHRVVHGGSRFVEAVRVDAAVSSALEELTALAPLHQPKSLAALAAVSEALPDLPAVACFDTAFHAGMSAAASTYAVPAEWRSRFGLRRYGFHGLSHAWIARRVPSMLSVDSAGLRIVSCHLGAGASLCAISGGVSIDTTMGFTPLEGLVMATRSGSVDPGMVLWLLDQPGMSLSDVSDALEHRSGMLGLAGTADMRAVISGADAGDADASVALDVYVWRLRASIAAMAAALGGLDVLAFTGGIGERAPVVRARAAFGLGFLGVAVSEDANTGLAGEGEVTESGSAVRTVVIHAREDLEIAHQVRTLLGS